MVQTRDSRDDLWDAFQQGLTGGLLNQSLKSCSRWAEHRRVMGAPFPGPYGFKHHPWCREIHNSKAAFTVAMKAAQLGITEAGINRAFFTLDQLKRDVLYVLPTTLNASDFSKARFATALKLSPYLKSLFVDTNTVGLKSTGTNVLYIRGSRGDSNLKSIPVSELVLDELDEMDTHAIWLALERLSGQIEKHVLAISTPTVPKYGIHKLYLTSTQEHFTFKCPHCGRWTELVWPDCVEIIGETVSDPRCNESFIKCKDCGHELEHKAKPEFLAGGIWQPTNLQVNPEESRGFYCNQLYSSTISPSELVIAHFRGLGDEAANTEFHNSKLGLPFIGEGAQVSDEMLDAAVRKHTINDRRPEVGGMRCITMGVDQGKTGYISVVEWSFDGDRRIDINLAAVGRLLWYGKFREEDLELPRPIDAGMASPGLRGGRRSQHQRRAAVCPQVSWLRSPVPVSEGHHSKGNSDYGRRHRRGDGDGGSHKLAGLYPRPVQDESSSHSCCRRTSRWSSANTSRTLCGPTRRTNTAIPRLPT